MTAKTTCIRDVHCISDLLLQIDDSQLAESEHAHVRLWFRGHSRGEWELQPGVYRSTFPARTEHDRLRAEQHLTQDFRVQSAGLLAGRETNAELYFLQQHYRMPTRLLDWTTSPLHALYFAVSENTDSDGKLWMMDAYQLAPAQKATDFRGIATARNPTFKTALRPIFDWQRPDDFPSFIIPVRPDHFDPRISLQRSCFTFHIPSRPMLFKEANGTLRAFRIPADSKVKIGKELSLLGINEFTVYGDLEGLGRWLKAAYSLRGAQRHD